jgi:hypothetical protein
MNPLVTRVLRHRLWRHNRIANLGLEIIDKTVASRNFISRDMNHKHSGWLTTQQTWAHRRLRKFERVSIPSLIRLCWPQVYQRRIRVDRITVDNFTHVCLRIIVGIFEGGSTEGYS